MLVWILIAACWAGLLLLILHDVTKDAGGSSAVTVASRNTLITTARGWRKLRKRTRDARAAANAKAAASKVANDVKAAADAKAAAASKAAADAKIAAVEKAPAASKAGTPDVPIQTGLATLPPETSDSSKKKWWSKDRRAQITSAELELTIAEAVRKSAPGCSNFIGVVVHHKKPKQYRDPNWGVRGVKFGKTDRRVVDKALARIVEQLQKEFRLTEPQVRN
jgi:hypothetical protein